VPCNYIFLIVQFVRPVGSGAVLALGIRQNLTCHYYSRQDRK